MFIAAFFFHLGVWPLYGDFFIIIPDVSYETDVCVSWRCLLNSCLSAAAEAQVRQTGVVALLFCAHLQKKLHILKSSLLVVFPAGQEMVSFFFFLLFSTLSHVLSSVNGLFYFPPTAQLRLPGSWDVSLSHQHILFPKSTKSFQGKTRGAGWWECWGHMWSNNFLSLHYQQWHGCSLFFFFF